MGTRPDTMADATMTFFEAVRAGDGDTVADRLRDNPRLVNEPGPHPVWGGRPTALHVAVENDRLEIAAFLLDRGADVNAPSDGYDGWTPLLIAVTGGKTAFIDLLLSRGARVNAWEAAAMGDVARLRTLLAENPALVRERGVNDAPPLHFASTVDVARVLVDAGAPLDALDKYGSTAARSAAYAGAKRAPVARFLMRASGERDLWLYAALDDVDGLATLVNSGADVNAARQGINPGSGPDETPLLTAASLGNLAAAKFLLDRGASPRGTGGNDATPLHYAAKQGSPAMVDLLLSAGADRGVTDRSHQATPADWAEFFGHRELAEYLRR